MPNEVICPKCKKPLENLKYSAVESVIQIFTKTAEYIMDHFINIESQEYYCPFCEETLFHNEEEAYNFLNGRVNNDGRDNNVNQ
jgi:uncharacterized protein YbaR (Trm112 family)